MSKSKITGEEERYSHTDLVDFQANVEGRAGRVTSPFARSWPRRSPRSRHEIDQRFDDVDRRSQPYRRGTGFVSYTALTTADTRKLSQAIDALAEPLSAVGAIVVTG